MLRRSNLTVVYDSIALAKPGISDLRKIATIKQLFFSLGVNYYINERESENSQLNIIKLIMDIVFSYFGISADEKNNKSHKREFAQCRQISMYFAKKFTSCSLATIGFIIGEKDHATVLHANKTVINLMDTDKNFRHQILEIEAKIMKLKSK